MREYKIMQDDKKIIAHYIGVNYDINGTFDDVISSYCGEFTDLDEVIIGRSEDNAYRCTIGNISEAYEYLRDEIVSKQPVNLYDYAECIQQVILRYFGNSFYVKRRLYYFPSDYEIKEKGKQIGKVSDLAHKHIAGSVERAMLTHNLLKWVGFDSTFKISIANINDKMYPHGFNLVSDDNKFYIFDVAIPTVVNNKVSPVICEISEEVYNRLITPGNDMGCKYSVNHIDAMKNIECNITYDALREEYTDVKKYTRRRRRSERI